MDVAPGWHVFDLGVRGARAQEAAATITNDAATALQNIDGTFGVGILRRPIGVLPPSGHSLPQPMARC